MLYELTEFDNLLVSGSVRILALFELLVRSLVAATPSMRRYCVGRCKVFGEVTKVFGLNVEESHVVSSSGRA